MSSFAVSVAPSVGMRMSGPERPYIALIIVVVVVVERVAERSSGRSVLIVALGSMAPRARRLPDCPTATLHSEGHLAGEVASRARGGSFGRDVQHGLEAGAVCYVCGSSTKITEGLEFRAVSSLFRTVS